MPTRHGRLRARCGWPLVVLAGTGLGACRGASSGSSGVSGRPPEAGDPLPAFSAADLGGDTVALDRMRGPLLVNLWATWCTPCRKETPYLEALYRRHADQGLRVVGISEDRAGALDEVRSFARDHGVTYTILRDPSMTAMDLFGVPGLPASYLVGRDGTIAFARVGPVTDVDTAFAGALHRVLEDSR